MSKPDSFGRDAGPGKPASGGQDFGFNRRGMPKSMSGPAATFMPPHILALFKPRDPLPYLPPAQTTTLGPSNLTGVAAYASHIETTAPPPVEHQETPAERRSRRRADRAKAHAAENAQAAAAWDPRSDASATRDAYKTLFVARLAYETSERKLQREFEAFGPVERARIVKGRDGRPRGYGFVEFRDEEDLKRAYRRGDGLRIDGRRVLVDVERGRTVRGWKPRRLGGGLGDTRRDRLPKKAEKAVGPGWVNAPIGGNYVVMSMEMKAAAAEADAAKRKAAAAAASGGGPDRDRGERMMHDGP